MIEGLQEQFKTEIKEVQIRNERRINVEINPIALLPICEFLYKEKGYRFIIASALHTRRGFEIYYHFSKDNTGLVLSIHVLLDHTNPEIESLSNMFNAANWIEREMHELFGIDFLNHPNMEALISEGNWAEGVFPYRNEFDVKPEGK